ncbi:MAG: flagellar motor protein MotB [Proteobacteria bacterium]|nr:flagellar motor protein MotB [Pseudomonadota bacterium]MBU1739111.1 flagellar motor protein MotB [Pseudomonadota bacterium]
MKEGKITGAENRQPGAGPLKSAPGDDEQPAIQESQSFRADAAGRLRVYNEDEYLRRPYQPRSMHWSIAWSDLMMTMFILFAVLYIYQASNHTFEENWQVYRRKNVTLAPGSSGPSSSGGPGDITDTALESTGEIFNLSRRIINSEDIGDFADVNLAPDESIRFTMTNDLLFDPGRAEVKPGAERALAGVARIILKTPYMINVVGHTDPTPISTDRYPSNWELSVARATAVARFMIDELKVPEKRFFVTGHSYFQPLRENDTPANRAVNRRVEIIITRDKPSY